MQKFVPYRELTTDRTPPHRSAWGFFGEDDQIGTVNWLGPEQVRRAASLVSAGRVFSLNWELEKPDPPLFNRQPMRHHIIALHPGADDYYDGFYPQTSSQWDALCHQLIRSTSATTTTAGRKTSPASRAAATVSSIGRAGASSAGSC